MMNRSDLIFDPLEDLPELWTEVTASDVIYSRAAVEALPVSVSARITLQALEQVPLVSARELNEMTGRSLSVVHRGLNELEDQGLVGREDVGSARGVTSRWFIEPGCCRLVGPGFGLWHDEWALCRLLERLPVLEGIYEAARAVTGLGLVRNFQWFGRAVWDAAVEYEGGWVMFMWSGLWQAEQRLRVLLGRVGHDLRRLSVGDETAWPAAICFVVNDEWQRELVFRAARREGLEGQVAVWCMADCQLTGVVDAGRSRGWVGEYVFARELVVGLWERRRRENVWRSKSGEVYWKSLLAVAEWKRATWRGVQAGVGESRKGRRVRKVLGELERTELVKRVWSPGGYRYSIEEKGSRLLSGIERMRRDAMPVGYGRVLGLEERGQDRHEDGVLQVMESFRLNGFAVAAGWRSWEHLGGGGGIAPDGMVYLEESPFGPGWCYVEFERRARGKVRMGRKLRGFVAEGRQDDWPVLFVLADALMERRCQEAGDEMGARILTATVDRLKEGGGVCGREVWRLGERSFTLAPRKAVEDGSGTWGGGDEELC